jgi:4-amino-4-deoxy-L-arabinose transferase-like glycosyltransferase
LALLLFYEGFKSGKTLPLMASYCSLALATLAKGPVAPLFYGLIVVTFLITTRSLSWKQLTHLKVAAGVLVFLGIVLPWYILVGFKTDGVWLEQFFFKHNVGRFADTMEGHGGFPLASLAILIFGLMPFSFFLPEMLKKVWADRRENQFLSLCLIAITVVIVFFAFSRTFLPGYIAPAFPFFALLLGHYWHSFITSGKVSVGTIGGGYFAVVISVAICVGLWQAPAAEVALRDLHNLWQFGLILVAGSVAALFFLYRGMRKLVFISYASSWMAFIALFCGLLFPLIDAQNPVNKGLPFLHDYQVACYRTLNPAFVFALKQPVEKLETPDEITAFLSQPSHRVITDLKSLKKLDSTSYTIVFKQKDLFERSTTIIIERAP